MTYFIIYFILFAIIIGTGFAYYRQILLSSKKAALQKKIDAATARLQQLAAPLSKKQVNPTTKKGIKVQQYQKEHDLTKRKIYFFSKQLSTKNEQHKNFTRLIATSIILFLLLAASSFFYDYKKSQPQATLVQLDSVTRAALINNGNTNTGTAVYDSTQLTTLTHRVDINTNKIDEIKERLDNATRSGWSFVSFLLYSAIFCCMGYLAYWLYKTNKKLKPLAVLTASMAFPIAKFFDSVLDNKFSLWPDSQIIFYQKNTHNHHEHNSGYSDKKVDSFTFGPFLPGTTIPDSNFAAANVENLKSRINNLKHRYSEVAIFGGVDIRPLKNDARKWYGDNLSLSQARAIFMKDKLHSIMPYIDTQKINTYSGGAIKYYDVYDSLRHLENRYVRILAKY